MHFYELRSWWRFRLRRAVLARSDVGINPARATVEGYVQFLIGSPKVVSATEAARVQPGTDPAPAHDAFTRLLHRLEPDADTLWQEVAPLIDPKAGVLVIDDSTLDKPRARHRPGTGRQRSCCGCSRTG